MTDLAYDDFGATAKAAAHLAGPVLVASGVEVELTSGRRILGPSSLTVLPGQLVALLGRSGSGKSTLLRLLAGVTEPTRGSVTLDGVPTRLRALDLGFVPQRETVHGRLTVREALTYAAALRSDDPDVTPRVDEVLDELDLAAHENTLVRDLSGGERRRAAFGLELVGRPGVLVLDEPTSGLDPVLERRIMKMLRRLADQGRAIVVSTHATASLDLCDTAVVLRAGEGVVYAGAPGGAVERLEAVAGPAAVAVPPAPVEIRPAPVTSAPMAVPPTPVRPLRRELSLLVSRYARTFARDRRTISLLVGQAPIIGVMIGVLFSAHALSRTSGMPSDAAQLAFLLMTGAIWLGVTASCREIVKERGIIERELDVGVRIEAYVCSKALVLFALTTVQVPLLVLAVAAFQPLGIGAVGFVHLLLIAIFTAWVGVALGLALSAIARSVDQAVGVIPLVLIPQLLYAGALVPLARMPRVVEALSQVTFARWSYSGLGAALQLDDRLDANTQAAAALGYGRNFFTLLPGAALAVLAVFAFVLLFVAVLVLNYRATPDDS